MARLSSESETQGQKPAPDGSLPDSEDRQLRNDRINAVPGRNYRARGCRSAFARRFAALKDDGWYGTFSDDARSVSGEQLLALDLGMGDTAFSARVLPGLVRHGAEVRVQAWWTRSKALSLTARQRVPGGAARTGTASAALHY